MAEDKTGRKVPEQRPEQRKVKNMKGITLLLALMIIAPIRVFAQGNISVGGVVAFYQPALDEIKEPYEESSRNGDIVDQLEGNFLFGGFIGYQPSPNWAFAYG